MNEEHTHGETLDLTDSDTLFLFGERTGQEAKVVDSASLIPRAFKRVVEDSGAGNLLRKVGVNPDHFPVDQIPIYASPDAMQAPGKPVAAIDLVAYTLGRFRDKRLLDERFEKSTDRWRKVPDRTSGYVPADAGSIRWTLMPRGFDRPFGYERVSPEVAQGRVSDAIGAAFAYLSTPFFIPSSIALDVATSVPPADKEDIRLPARYAMVFHDGVPLTVVAGDDDAVETYAEGNQIVRDDALLLGGLIAADDDGAIGGSIAFLIMAKPTSQLHETGKPVYSWRPIPVPMATDSVASNVLWNYAALLAWEDWQLPPKIPEASGKQGSRGHLRAIARSEEGQRGAFHEVRILDHRPPSQEELDEAEARERASGRQLKYRHRRRAHWRRRIRVAIRDEYGRPVGPIRGPEAVEGVTFTRRRKFIPWKMVREDLPERPVPQERVYRIPGNAQRVGERR